MSKEWIAKAKNLPSKKGCDNFGQTHLSHIHVFILQIHVLPSTWFGRSYCTYTRQKCRFLHCFDIVSGSHRWDTVDGFSKSGGNAPVDMVKKSRYLRRVLYTVHPNGGWPWDF